jgi:hypothetical protein
MKWQPGIGIQYLIQTGKISGKQPGEPKVRDKKSNANGQDLFEKFRKRAAKSFILCIATRHESDEFLSVSETA